MEKTKLISLLIIYNMTYLANPLCDLQPLFDIDYSKKVNIVSCSFFKLEDGAYKNFNRYTDGLSVLHKYVKKNMKTFNIRLFIDESIHNDKHIMMKINKLEKIQCVLVDCKNLKSNKNTTKHRGLLGTLFRFLPLFNFKNNDANFVIVSDIDWTQKDNMDRLIESYNLLDKNKYKIELFMVGRYYKIGITNYDYYRNGLFIPYTNADRILNNKRKEKKVLINFIKDDSNLGKKTYYRKHSTLVNKKFVFGIDEYFLNKILIDNLIDNKKNFGMKTKMGLTYEFYYIIFCKKTFSKFEKRVYKDFYTNVLQDIENFKYENVKQAYQFIDKIIYIKDDIKELTKTQIKVFTKIYLYFIYNYNNTSIVKLFIAKDLLKLFMSDEYFGVIFMNKITFFNSNYKNIILNELKLPTTIIKHLKKIRKKVLHF